MIKRILLIALILIVFVFGSPLVFAQSPSPTPTPSTSSRAQDLQDQIKDLEAKIGNLQSQERTLSSQIGVMDNQIKLTTLRINATKEQIADLALDIDTAGKKIDNIDDSLDNLTKVLVNRIQATYKIGSAPSFQILMASNDVSDFVERANYLRIAQAHDRRLIYDTVQARNDYENQKTLFEEEKLRVEALNKELQAYTNELSSQKTEKDHLLAETQGNESNYQQLLSQARAQLAAFSNFTTSQGGASLLGNQTQCDDWGCYYNQRDSAWGGSSLNGTGYTLASDGCLVTAMAMIYTHYGHRSVTPQAINSMPSNFASYFPAYLKKVITADGATSQRIYAEIDSILSSGNPAVIGISYDSGNIADHFVVFTNGSGGNYTMKDPFTPNGNNTSFRERYPSVRIVEVEKVSF